MDDLGDMPDDKFRFKFGNIFNSIGDNRRVDEPLVARL
jgi:hypothetical protein